MCLCAWMTFCWTDLFLNSALCLTLSLSLIMAFLCSETQACGSVHTRSASRSERDNGSHDDTRGLIRTSRATISIPPQRLLNFSPRDVSQNIRMQPVFKRNNDSEWNQIRCIHLKIMHDLLNVVLLNVHYKHANQCIFMHTHTYARTHALTLSPPSILSV